AQTTAKMTFTYPIGKCPDGTKPDPNENYTVTLGPNFDLTNPDVAKGGHKPVTPKKPRLHPTQLDIVTDLLKVKKTGTVTIVLTGKWLNFTEHDVFSGADEGAQEVFCDVTFAKDRKSLTFTVLPNVTYPYASYILGLVADDKDPKSADKLTAFIDPGVDNDGFQ
ncbi:MAG: hypothetical protein ACREEG_12390, partial [Phenylobacterium sp.]